MTQFQFDVICKIIDTGAPALAAELCNSLHNLVQDFNAVLAENETLKAQANSTEEKTESTEEVIF